MDGGDIQQENQRVLRLLSTLLVDWLVDWLVGWSKQRGGWLGCWLERAKGWLVSWLVGVRLQGFRLGIALGDSVRIREGLSGIAVGGRRVRPRDGKARDRRPVTAAASAARQCRQGV
jgi:hypothetical protein